MTKELTNPEDVLRSVNTVDDIPWGSSSWDIVPDNVDVEKIPYFVFRYHEK